MQLPSPLRFSPGDRAGNAIRAGVAVSAGWLVLVAIVFTLAGAGALNLLPAIMIIVAVAGPIALVASVTVSLVMVAQAEELRALRAALLQLGEGQGMPATPRPAEPQPNRAVAALSERVGELETWLARRAEAIERAGAMLEAAARAPEASEPASQPAEPAAAPPPRRPAAAPPPPHSEPEADSPELALHDPGEEAAPRVSQEVLIRALQFPADADDREGFDALRAAMRSGRDAQLVTAAQDVLTLLSQSGLYMDDLEVAPAPVETWRHFARGVRGPVIDDVGGVRAEEAVEICAVRMRQDTIFRDAVHHFLRLFDHRLAEIEPEAGDATIAAWTATRSARAFMLLGRAAGMFS